ncbi:MAG: carboxypeptidase-like regulatory domain-containing protein, partial [Bryobacteraceae bacterium]
VLGRKVGIVSGIVTDAVTGKAVGATIHLSRLDDGNFVGRSVKGPFRLLIPPDTPVYVYVQAPGYERWSYPGVAGPSDVTPLLLSSGETKKINVKLMPTAH